MGTNDLAPFLNDPDSPSVNSANKSSVTGDIPESNHNNNIHHGSPATASTASAQQQQATISNTNVHSKELATSKFQKKSQPTKSSGSGVPWKSEVLTKSAGSSNNSSSSSKK
uniref:Uncharacterized protein n=1 Tax=Arion vulgaris TaxID=1028688 RepID=A0A0B6ZEX6_9EUPU